MKMIPRKIIAVLIASLTLGACSTPPDVMDAYRNWNPDADTYDTMSMEDLESEAELGSTGALVELGLRLMNGDQIERDDVRAVEVFKELSEMGDPRGHHFLGAAYVQGAGIEMNEQAAVDLFRRSAEDGYDLAQYWYGYMLSRGRGVPQKDWKEAAVWFRKAAESGNPDGQFALADAIISCRGGVEENFEEAGKWLRRAEQQGHLLAGANLRRLIDVGLIEWKKGDRGERPVELQPVGVNFCDPDTGNNS